jgi:hypothetical protein
MKKFVFIYLAFCLIAANPVTGQKSNFMNKVTKSANSILGKPEKAEAENTEPEPSCASEQAIVAMDLGGKLQLDYRELSVSILSDGRILAQAHGSDEYYVAKDGVTTGPFKAGDPQIADFVPKEKDDGSEAAFLAKYKPYITKSGEKYLITFAGKKYGPYARVDNFTVSKSKDKFAAIATETVAMTEDQGKIMEEAMKNAKNDDERMQLAMEYAQQMQENMSQGGGGPESMQPKLVTNIPNTKWDLLKSAGGQLNGNIKYDDILIFAYDKIIDLQMKVIFTLKSEAIGAKDLFVNANNTKLAYYNSGTLTFNDNTTMTELFNPFLSKTDGKIYLNYMYYSPKRNAIMQHKILF